MNLDRLRAEDSANRIQELSYPHLSQQHRSAMELNLRERLKDPSVEQVAHYNSEAEYRARMALMGVGFSKN